MPAEGEAAVVAEEKIHEKTLEGITFETTLFPRYAIVATVEAAEETVRQLSARALRQFDDLEAENPFLRALLASLTNRRK